MAYKTKVPKHIMDCWLAYDGGSDLPGVVVCVRESIGWFAILLDGGSGEFFAIDFNTTLEGWEVTNDYIGPFTGPKEFLSEPTTLTFL